MRRGVGEKPTFLSTRVEEPVGETSDTSIDHDWERQHIEEDLTDELISEEEPDAPTLSVKPYNSLLQSLSVDMLQGQLPRKRRRIEVAETVNVVLPSTNADESAGVYLAENDLDPVNEPDGDDHMVLEDTEDTDEETNRKEGRFSTLSACTELI